jgi:hypothetical protein
MRLSQSLPVGVQTWHSIRCIFSPDMGSESFY